MIDVATAKRIVEAHDRWEAARDAFSAWSRREETPPEFHGAVEGRLLHAVCGTLGLTLSAIDAELWRTVEALLKANASRRLAELNALTGETDGDGR